MKLSFNHLLLLLFLVVLLGIGALGYAYSENNKALVSTHKQIEATNEILVETGAIDALDEENESAMKSYLSTGDSAFLLRSRVGNTAIRSHIGELRSLIKSSSIQIRKVDSLEYALQEKSIFFDSAAALTRAHNAQAALFFLSGISGQGNAGTPGQLISGIEKSEREFLQHEKEVNENTMKGINRLFWIVILVPVLLLFIALCAIKRAFSERQRNEEKIQLWNSSLEKRVVSRTEELAQSEKKYRNLFENNPMPMWVIDEETRAFLDVNEAAIRHYGYSRNEFLGMTAFDIRPESEYDRLKSLDTADVDGPYNAGIWTHQKKDRSTIEVEISAHELLFEDRQARLILANDITRRRIAEGKLEASNRELNRIFNAINEGLFSMDTTTYQYIQVSSACEKIYGYPLADFYANSNLWYDVVHPEDKSIIDEQKQYAEKGIPVTMEYRIIHKDTSIRWLKASIAPTLNALGQLVRIDGIVSDITEQRQAERLLRESEANLKAILDNTDTGYLLLDTGLNVISFNRQVDQFAAKHLLHPLAVGTSFVSYFPEEKRKFRLEMVQQVLDGADISYESSYANTDGSLTWYEITMFNVSDERGKTLGLAMAVADISDRKQAETEIKSLNESLEKRVAERTSELEETNKELESFSYTVSHDLRSPLRIINGFAKILIKREKDAIGPESLQILNDITQTTANMGQLIDDLLRFSQLGRTTLAKCPVSLNDEVKTVIAEVKKSLNGSCLAQIELHELVPAACDPGLMKQVWTNLISNAVKYSRKKENPVIEIGTKHLNAETVYYVKDNGAGFDMQYANKLFGVFQRLHTQAEYEGTGVGLALVHRIISKHGGKIWAEAAVGEGATFYFTLP